MKIDNNPAPVYPSKGWEEHREEKNARLDSILIDAVDAVAVERNPKPKALVTFHKVLAFIVDRVTGKVKRGPYLLRTDYRIQSFDSGKGQHDWDFVQNYEPEYAQEGSVRVKRGTRERHLNRRSRRIQKWQRVNREMRADRKVAYRMARESTYGHVSRYARMLKYLEKTTPVDNPLAQRDREWAIARKEYKQRQRERAIQLRKQSAV